MIIPEMVFKICSKCGKPKHESLFHKTSRKYSTSSGYEEMYNYSHSKCAQCRNEERRKYYQLKKKENK